MIFPERVLIFPHYVYDFWGKSLHFLDYVYEILDYVYDFWRNVLKILDYVYDFSRLCFDFPGLCL